MPRDVQFTTRSNCTALANLDGAEGDGLGLLRPESSNEIRKDCGALHRAVGDDHARHAPHPSSATATALAEPPAPRIRTALPRGSKPVSSRRADRKPLASVLWPSSAPSRL